MLEQFGQSGLTSWTCYHLVLPESMPFLALAGTPGEAVAASGDCL